MRINNNIMAMNAHRQLGANQTAGSKSMERLSSGLRINRAGDDAAGLAISEKMRGQIRGLNQASRNAQDGISLIQTAEGSLNETHAILQRMRELATQAANDTNTDADRGEIQKEINALTTEINRIGETTQFNSIKLLDGSVSVADKTNANIKGNSDIAAQTTIVTTATKSTAQSGHLPGTIEIHDATKAAVTATQGATRNSAGTVNLSGAIGAGQNELVIRYNGQDYTLGGANALGDLAVDADDTAVTAWLTDFNTKLTNVLGGAHVTAVWGGAGDGAGSGYFKLETANGGSAQSISVIGGGAAAVLFGDNFATTQNVQAGKDSNRNFTIQHGSTTATVQLETGTRTLAQIASDLNSKLDGSGGFNSDLVDVTASGGRITIEAKAGGSNNSLTNVSGPAADLLKLSSASGGTTTAGKDVNNQFNITVDGQAYNITLDNGTYSQNDLAQAVQSKINQAISANPTADKNVTVTVADNRLTITSGTEGASGNVSIITGSAAGALGGTFGITAGNNGSASDMKFQIGANNGQLMSIDIADMRGGALQVAGNTSANAAGVTNAKFTGQNGVSNGTDSSMTQAALDVSSVEYATAAIEVMDKAIATVSAERSKLGAFQNRLEHTINNLGTSSENLQAAESRIRDVDMAAEMMDFTKANILNQAATAMLAQGNQAPSAVLQLLG